MLGSGSVVGIVGGVKIVNPFWGNGSVGLFVRASPMSGPLIFGMGFVVRVFAVVLVRGIGKKCSLVPHLGGLGIS